MNNMWTIEAIGAVTTIIAVTGVILNNRGKAYCFYLWLISNALSMGLHLHAALFSLAARDAIFLVLALEGIILWRKHPPKK